MDGGDSGGRGWTVGGVFPKYCQHIYWIVCKRWSGHGERALRKSLSASLLLWCSVPATGPRPPYDHTH